MKVQAKVTGVCVPAGHVALREGEVMDVSAEVGARLIALGVATDVEAKRAKPAPNGKRMAEAPENKEA